MRYQKKVTLNIQLNSPEAKLYPKYCTNLRIIFFSIYFLHFDIIKENFSSKNAESNYEK